MKKKSSPDKSRNEIEDAILHLDEVVRHTDEAVLAILHATGKISEIAGNNPDISKLVTDIYEHCNFQDITRQRLIKIAKTLTSLESGTSIKKTKRSKAEELMSGPQLPKDTPSQEAIDNLFSTLK